MNAREVAEYVLRRDSTRAELRAALREVVVIERLKAEAGGQR